MPPSRFGRLVRRSWISILGTRLPRGAGIAATVVVIVASLAYGVVKGDHVPVVVAVLKDVRDGAANALGFRIVSLALSGNQHVSREEILAVAGVTGHTSLLFLDVETVRERLKTNPWIADASVLKLYPGELDVAAALDRLIALDRDAKLISRDLLAIDLRLPDRVTVRLSAAAAQARADALKEKEKKLGKKEGKA